MSLSEIISSFAAGTVDWNRRPVVLNFGRLQSSLGRLLALQHAHVREELMTGIHGYLTCVSTRHDLSPKLFIGVPASLRLVTDHGQLHFSNAITLTGDPEWDMQTTNQRQFVITSIRHDVWNHLPKGMTERVQALFIASQHLAYSSPPRLPAATPEVDTRYESRFTCVRRGVPFTPAYDPKIDSPPVHLSTGTIVGRQGEEVFCDAGGRGCVRIQGLDPADHTHAQGAGTDDDGGDSAPVRVKASLAGGSFGALFLPRVGMEVLIGCLGGDPDRSIIINVLSNGMNPPAAFTHVGSLPGNCYVSGIKTKEIKGRRYNQLCLDDTPSQISSRLASEHAHSQLNLGYLTQPRQSRAISLSRSS